MSANPDAGTDVDADPEANTEIETDAEADIGTANTMRERSNESRIKLWIVLNGSRPLVTGLLAMGFFVSFVVIGTLFVPNFEQTW